MCFTGRAISVQGFTGRNESSTWSENIGLLMMALGFGVIELTNCSWIFTGIWGAVDVSSSGCCVAVADGDTIAEVMNNGITHVFHIAANILLNQTYEQMYIPNVLGTRIMLDAFVNSKAKCFIHTSSIAVYDDSKMKKRIFRANETTPFGPLNGKPYPVTKRIAENTIVPKIK